MDGTVQYQRPSTPPYYPPLSPFRSTPPYEVKCRINLIPILEVGGRVSRHDATHLPFRTPQSRRCLPHTSHHLTFAHPHLSPRILWLIPIPISARCGVYLVVYYVVHSGSGLLSLAPPLLPLFSTHGGFRSVVKKIFGPVTHLS